jgi:HSP20 family molecular chaperone IbpA
MNTRTHTTSTPSRHRKAFEASNATFRQPSYDCREHPDAVSIVVYVPGVGASGVEIEAYGADLVITAHKTRFVRVNWEALNLEGIQRDYRLRLRLGTGFAYSQMQASIEDGVLTITVPKRQDIPASAHRVRRVA